MKLFFTFFFLIFYLNTYSQSFSENDIKKLALEVDKKIKGVDVDGMTARGCIALGRTLVYQYDIPANWEFPNNMKTEIINNFETAGLSKFYFQNGINVLFYYYHQNSLIKKINIQSSELSPFKFELSEYINLTGHPKAKEVSLKFKYPEKWEVLEGDRPNVVKKFVFDSNTFLILIKDNFTFLSRKETRTLLSDEEFSNQLLQEFTGILKNSRILEKKLITVDRYPALEYTVEGEMERSGIEFKLLMKGWYIFHEDKAIIFQAAGSNKSEFQSLENLYTSIINSVIFPEQYN